MKNGGMNERHKKGGTNKRHEQYKQGVQTKLTNRSGTNKAHKHGGTIEMLT